MNIRIGMRRIATFACNVVIAGLVTATPALAKNDRDNNAHSNRKPLPVVIEGQPVAVDIGSPQRHPLQTTQLSFNELSPITVQLVEQIPEGQRLVMQHVSIEARTALKVDATATCTLVVERTGGNSNLNMTVNKRRTGNLHQHLVEGPITMYAEAGEGVLAKCVALQIDELGQTEPALVVVLDTTLVGFLIDVP